MTRVSLIIGLLLVIVLSIANCNSLVATGQQGYEYLFIFYIPNGSVELLLNTTQNKINTSILQLEPDLPASPDFYLYWLLTGKKPQYQNVSLININVDQNLIERAWKNASLIDIPIVDPTRFAFAINPLSNISNVHIQPEIITLPINNTGYSSSLNTSITTRLVEYKLELYLVKYNLTFTVENIRAIKMIEPKSVFIEEPEELSGKYYITFYILKYNETHIELLYPGSIKTTGYHSEGVREIDTVTTHWYLLIKYSELLSNLPQDAIEWWINRTADTLFQFTRHVIYYSNNIVNIIYAPQISIAKNLLNNEYVERAQIYLYDRIVFALQAFASVEKPDFLVLFMLIGDENNVVYASKTMNLLGDIEIDITISQFTASLLALSDLTPLAFRIDPEMRTRIDQLEKQVGELATNISQLNNKLSETIDKLVNCESAKELAETRLANIDTLRKEAEELLNTVRQYLLATIAIPVAISALIGFLALKISSKKRSR